MNKKSPYFLSRQPASHAQAEPSAQGAAGGVRREHDGGAAGARGVRRAADRRVPLLRQHDARPRHRPGPARQQGTAEAEHRRRLHAQAERDRRHDREDLLRDRMGTALGRSE